MRDAAVYIVPLRIGGGTRLKIFEAMAMGKAVVSTTDRRRGTAGDRRRARACWPTSRTAFARAVVHLLRDVGAPRAARNGGARARASRATTGRRSPANWRLRWNAAGMRFGSHGRPRARAEIPHSAQLVTAKLHRCEHCRMRVSVFGLGYVGSVSAASFAADGHEVVGVDVNADKVAAINAGPQPDRRAGARRSAARSGVAAGRLRATTEHGRCDSRQRGVARVRRHAEPAERQPRPDVSRARLRADRRRAARQARLSRRRRPQHRAAGDDARARHSGARARRRARSTARASACRSTPSSCARARRSRTSASRR